MNDLACHRLKELALLLGVLCSLPALSQETQRQYLSGRGKDDAVPWRFLCTAGAQSGYWTNLPVPSNWEMHGFGTLNYKKDSTNAWEEKGLYERNFSVPASWAGKRVFLVFEGAMTDTSAKLNGETVGPTHQGGFYRFKCEVTKPVRFGATNRLEVTVAKHSANESVNKAERLADYWVFGGIYRPVHLEAVPMQFIERVAIDAQHDGAFTMDVFANGITSADAEMNVEAQIMTLDGRLVGSSFSTNLPLGVPALAGRDRLKAELRTKVVSPLAWTAETPNLYRVEVQLKHANQVLHRFSQRFGFRTMEVRDGDGLYVNGKRAVLKGANRHSFWPDSGRCLSEAVHRLDIETMKDMNMNAVRMSHYPPDAEFLDLCDELGLYVLDELAGWHNHYDTEVGRKLVEEMVTRDVNHPSILFWDNGNEGGFNTNLDRLFGEFDPQKRRVLHPWMPFNGVNTAHYLAYDNARIACEGKAMFYHHGNESVDTNDTKKYIYMPTEFLHGMFDGGAGAGLEDYWRMMSASKVLGGGFIWALTDDGLKRPDTGQIDTAGNQAPDGIVGPYRQREGSFYAIKEIWSPIQVTRDTNNTLTIENRFGHTDARECQFVWQTRQLWRGFGTNAGTRILAEGKVSGPNIAPGGKGTLQLPLPQNWDWDRADAIALRVNDPQGRELWTWVWPSQHLGGSYPLANVSSFGPPTTIETAEAFKIRTRSLGSAGIITVAISKQSGLLASIEADGETISLTGPRPVVGNAKLKAIERTNEGLAVTVKATFDGELEKLVWHVRNDGLVMCDYTYHCVGTNEAHGVLFDYPQNHVKRKRWLGDGPYRVWKNRLRGVTLNVWENTCNNTITGWRDWVYPEFKGCFANVHWLQLETTEGLITIVPDNNPFVQVLTPEEPPDNLVGKTKVNLPQCGLGFLHAIPPVGSKFKPADQGGPQGQPNVASGEYSGSVSFHFGKLP